MAPVSLWSFQNSDPKPFYGEIIYSLSTSRNKFSTTDLVQKVVFDSTRLLVDKYSASGRFSFPILILDSKDSTRKIIDHKKMTFEILEPESNQVKNQNIVETDEFKDILGHVCRKYIYRHDKDEIYLAKGVGYYWLATDLIMENKCTFSFMTGFRSSSSIGCGINNGIVLRIEMSDDNGNFYKAYDAISISEGMNSVELFELPKTYKLIK